MKAIQAICGLLLLAAPSFANSSDVVVNTTNGRDYYHLEITLAKNDFTLTWPDEWFDPHWPESTSGTCVFTEESGGFIIFIKKSIFPVPAPNCKSDWLRVVMDGRSKSSEDVASKKKLWDRLQAVKAGELEQTTAVIELNPYVWVVSEDPLVLELQYCNLYFRTAWGKYIDHIESI